LKLQVYSTLDELTCLRAAWDELLQEYPLSSTFSTWEWLSSWWESFGEQRRLLVLALLDANSQLIGLAPFSISKERFRGVLPLRVLRLMGDGSGDSDNLDLPVRPGFEPRFAEAAFQFLRQEKRQWDVCELNTLPIGSPAANGIAQCAGSAHWTCVQSLSQSSAIPLPATWPQYVERISTEDRKNLVRYTERLKRRYATRIYRCSREADLSSCLDGLFRLHQGRWRSAGKLGSFASSQRRDFYQRLSRRLLNRGWLQLWALELDSQIAAVQFAFRYRDTVYQLQEGYDHTRPSDRLGFVLRGEVLKQLILEKVRRYDFLGGEDEYKSRWAAEPGRYRKICLARPLTAAAALLRSAETADRAKSWLRLRLPGPAWRVLHQANIALRGEPEVPADSARQAEHSQIPARNESVKVAQSQSKAITRYDHGSADAAAAPPGQKPAGVARFGEIR